MNSIRPDNILPHIKQIHAEAGNAFLQDRSGARACQLIMARTSKLLSAFNMERTNEHSHKVGDRVQATEWSAAEQGEQGVVIAVEPGRIGVQFDRAVGNVANLGHTCNGRGRDGFCLWDLGFTYLSA